MVRLQPRDMILLKSLARYGVLSTSQIQRIIFPEIRFTTMMRRLRLLEKSYYIKRGITLTDQSFTWSLAFRGEHLLSVQIPGSFSNRNTIDHDVLINDIRVKLEEFGLAKNWKPEFEIKSEAFKNQSYRKAKERLVPDGILTEPINGQAWNIAIEVEITRKSESRYKRLFMEYTDHREFNRIWYFVPAIRDAQAILKMAEKTLMFDTKRLWFSEINSFLKSQDSQVCSVYSAKWFKLSEMGFDNFNRKTPAQSAALGVSRPEAPELSAQGSANSLPSQEKNQNPELGDRPLIAPDHSPSTMESGQELWPGIKEEKLENTVMVVSDVKKCG